MNKVLLSIFALWGVLIFSTLQAVDTKGDNLDKAKKAIKKQVPVVPSAQETGSVPQSIVPVEKVQTLEAQFKTIKNIKDPQNLQSGLKELMNSIDALAKDSIKDKPVTQRLKKLKNEVVVFNQPVKTPVSKEQVVKQDTEVVANIQKKVTTVPVAVGVGKSLAIAIPAVPTNRTSKGLRLFCPTNHTRCGLTKCCGGGTRYCCNAAPGKESNRCCKSESHCCYGACYSIPQIKCGDTVCCAKDTMKCEAIGTLPTPTVAGTVVFTCVNKTPGTVQRGATCTRSKQCKSTDFCMSGSYDYCEDVPGGCTVGTGMCTSKDFKVDGCEYFLQNPLGFD